MNVLVSNLNGNSFINLDIDVIKSITGEFTADEIVQSFSNFFFNRMFLDITAIKDYNDVNNLKTLSVGLDVNKIIFLLPEDNVVISDTYISSLISMGIYNFAKNEAELKYLYNNPNSYKDVAHLHVLADNYNSNLGNNSNISNSNGTNDISDNDVKIEVNRPKVIGVKNFTNHAGATSLIYMLKKQLSQNYYVIALEVNKRDFMFFNDKDMISCNSSEVRNFISKYSNVNVILIDLNDLDALIIDSVCDDVIYLMESSTLMINKLVMLDSHSFSSVSDKKVILNHSLLNLKDIRQLEFEAGIKFFGVLPPLNDREDNSNVLIPFLSKFGLYEKNN